MGLMKLFKALIVIQLLFSVGINIYIQTIPDPALKYITSFSDLGNEISLESVSEEFQSNLNRQTTIPVIDVGALVFYSGNILIDLLLNFAFAIPEMVGIIINAVGLLLNINNALVAIVELFTAVLVGVLYFIGVMETLTSIRSGRVIE